MKNGRTVNKRLIVYAVFAFVIILLICVRLFWMQIVLGDKYLTMAEQKGTRNVIIPAPRGEIVDRFGMPLVVNKTGYALQIQKTNANNDEFDNRILQLYLLAKEKNQKICEELPISFYPFNFTFSDEAEGEEEAKKAELEWKKKWELEGDLSAEEVVYALKERFNIRDGYSPDEIRMIVGVRYDMVRNNFSVSTPYTFASDIDMEFVTVIKESGDEFECASVVDEYVRNYPNGEFATHILGRVGKISDTEYEALKDEGYKFTDEIGKQGIEKVCEQYLRGEDGKREYFQTNNGFEERNEFRVEAKAGNYVMLTIDGTMQAVLENSLKETIGQIRRRGEGYKNVGGDAFAGAAVVLDVNSGEVLAMASYPTYDPNSFNEIYSQMIKDETKPLWNRAIGGAYAPGSTFKMLTSIAALEENVVDVNTTIEDEGVYKFYPDYQPKCWIYSRTGKTHGACDVAKALENSCNYFYYEVGRLMGIDKLNRYQRLFGLGDYSGIELSQEEAKGTVAGPEERKRVGGREWSGGDTIQASIGQSDNLITPIQLANYVATLVNGGKRYKPHLVKEVRSPADGSLVYEPEIEVLEDIDLKDENIGEVLQGMLDVTQEGTASSIFEGYPVKIGGKTGSAQVAKGSDNGVFVAFAPYDNPQIAVAIIVEHGNSGGDVAPISRAVFDYYFNINNSEEEKTISRKQPMVLMQ